MKREEFLLGTTIYALIISAGFCGPIFKKLGQLPWDKPIDSAAWGRFPLFDWENNQKANKAVLVSNVRKILRPDTQSATLTYPLDSIHQKLEENWKRMASHPAVLGNETEPSQNVSSFFGKKTEFKLNPVTQKKKVTHFEEPTKG